jgi:methyl-accepting chemotaxis protein
MLSRRASRPRFHIATASAKVAVPWNRRRIVSAWVPAAMHRLAEGDLTAPVGDTARTDEVGEMNRALEAFKATVIERQKLQSEREAERENREKRASRLESLVTQFQSATTEIVRGVAAGAKEMQTNAEKLSAIADKTNAEAGTVANASQSATSSVATVADAAAELSGSITEINQQINHSSQMANQAVADVARTNQTVETLNAAAQKDWRRRWSDQRYRSPD